MRALTAALLLFAIACSDDEPCEQVGATRCRLIVADPSAREDLPQDGESVCRVIPEPTLGDIQSAILTPGCALQFCHQTALPAEDLVLTDAQSSFEGLVGVPSVQRPGWNLVEPGAPERSYLINKLIGEDMAAQSSSGEDTFQQPPFVDGFLCDRQVGAIEEWIRRGALRQ